MVYAYIYSKCTSFFLQNALSLFKIINKNQTKQYICEQNKYRSIQNSN